MGNGARAAAIPNPAETHQCDTWIQSRISQSVCGNEVCGDGAGHGTGQIHGNYNPGHHCHWGLDSGWWNWEEYRGRNGMGRFRPSLNCWSRRIHFHLDRSTERGGKREDQLWRKGEECGGTRDETLGTSGL